MHKPSPPKVLPWDPQAAAQGLPICTFEGHRVKGLHKIGDTSIYECFVRSRYFGWKKLILQEDDFGCALRLLDPAASRADDRLRAYVAITLGVTLVAALCLVFTRPS